MKTQIHPINLSIKQSLTEFIHSKLNKLEKLYQRTMEGEVFLKVNNEGVKNKTVEIKLLVPGNQFFASESALSFEEATDNTVEALRRQLKKFKEKKLSKRSQ